MFIRDHSFCDSLHKTRRNTIFAYIVSISAMILSEYAFHSALRTSLAGGNYYGSAVKWGTFFSLISFIIGGVIAARVLNLFLDSFSVDMEIDSCVKCKWISKMRRYNGQRLCDQCLHY